MAPFNWYYKEGKTQRTECRIENMQLRFILPSDLNDVLNLCAECFPIHYPMSWYEEITTNPRLFSLCAIVRGKFIGMIVAEVKEYRNLSKEDKGIIAPQLGGSTEVSYILSLAVDKQYRGNGIASILLESLVSYLTSSDCMYCKAVFLHVLTTNSTAIRFYEHRKFRLHKFLPYYYQIEGGSKDGFSYVLYINGGRPPNSFIDGFRYHIKDAYESSVLSWMLQKLNPITNWTSVSVKDSTIHYG